MEPPRGFWASLWSFICFLPFFVGLLLLGIIKGILFFPVVCLIMTVGNTAVVLGLWPAHALWTFYCLTRSKQLGPILKSVLFVVVALLVVMWPIVAILGSVLGGSLYGFLAPLVATFEAVGEGKDDEFVHCIVDGTWTTVKGTFTAVRDFTDVCFHSYFSVMNDLRLQEPPNGKRYEIWVYLLLESFLLGLLGIIADVPVITVVALLKSPVMLFKGWHRLVHDLIGREGPFLETACVPFAGLAILLWPTAVVGAVIASFLSSFVLGGYASVVTYQEASLKMGMFYVVSSLAIYDEYTNDILGMPEGSCFPRLKFQRNESLRSGSFSVRTSSRSDKQVSKPPPSRVPSFKHVILDLKPVKLLEYMFRECKVYGEKLVAEGVIIEKDIEECISSKDNGIKVISIGLPAYTIFHALLRSLESGSDGILLKDGTEITSMNRPRESFFDWFFDPLMVIKEQIRAHNFSVEEEEYLAKLVLLQGDPVRLKAFNNSLLIKNERRGAELGALARRLRGITKSISRYPTAKRRFDSLAMSLSQELGSKMGSRYRNGARVVARSKSAIVRLLSQKSFGGRMGGSNGGSQKETDVEVANGSSHDAHVEAANGSSHDAYVPPIVASHSSSQI